jgi:hypothetical protein
MLVPDRVPTVISPFSISFGIMGRDNKEPTAVLVTQQC